VSRIANDKIDYAIDGVSVDMATMRDVARLAGVSTATVSHVLNKTRFVEPETSGRVHAAIGKLGYEIDEVAQSLRTGATRTIALIVPDLINPFYGELAVAVQRRALLEGYDVVVFNTDVPDGTMDVLFEHYLRAIRRKRYDAVIVAEALPIEPAARQRLVATETPVILIGGLPLAHADRVFIDDYRAACDMMAYLTSQGYSTIAHISGVLDMPSAADRQRGYRDGLSAAGLQYWPELDVVGDFMCDGAYRAMQKILAGPRRPAAVFAANDITAIGAQLACLDAGIRVPEDVAIAGFDDLAVGTSMRPALTTIYHAQREIGEEATRLALARIRDEGPEQKQTVIVPHRLVIRQSA
jgi:LacI family transcriptional regulator